MSKFNSLVLRSVMIGAIEKMGERYGAVMFNSYEYPVDTSNLRCNRLDVAHFFNIAGVNVVIAISHDKDASISAAFPTSYETSQLENMDSEERGEVFGVMRHPSIEFYESGGFSMNRLRKVVCKAMARAFEVDISDVMETIDRP